MTKEEKAERLENVKSCVSSAISALEDVEAWLREDDLDQAMAALESTREHCFDVHEWLEEMVEESAVDKSEDTTKEIK